MALSTIGMDSPKGTEMRIREWMSPDPVAVRSSTPVREARRLLAYYGIRHLPVVDDGRVVGMISDRDVRVDEEILQRIAVGDTRYEERPVEAVMSAPVHSISPDETVEAAARLMLSRRISALPVMAEDGALLGMITTTDCLLASLTPVEPAAR